MKNFSFDLIMGFDDASLFYDALLEDIRAAEKYIFMEYYVFREDTISTTILESLLRSAWRLAKKGYFKLIIHPSRFHHEKAVSVDGQYLMVSSYILDFLSFKLNHELGVLIADPVVVGEFDRHYDEQAQPTS
ncbi:MAG: hypothetical protein GXY24_03165 [Bacteroidales bacterium]|nr:hypothetical protein [Bacteroidales bacterium]